MTGNRVYLTEVLPTSIPWDAVTRRLVVECPQEQAMIDAAICADCSHRVATVDSGRGYAVICRFDGRPERLAPARTAANGPNGLSRAGLSARVRPRTAA